MEPRLDVKGQLDWSDLQDWTNLFGETAAVQYSQLVAARTRNGRPITVEDAQIAAIALASGLRLATRNEKDFTEISGLGMVYPWAASGG